MISPRTILHTEASVGWGGQEIRIYTEMLAMRERGHRMLLSAPKASRILAKATQAGFEVRPLDDRRLAYPASILGMRRWIRKTRINVVNPHSSRDGWIAGIAGRMAGVPLVLRSRHIEVDYPNRFSSRIVFGRLPHHVLTTSERISSRLASELGLEPSRVTCVPTGIDLRKFHPTIEGVLHRELGLSPEVQVIGMISVLRSWKGHEYFLRAAASLAQSDRGLRFVIAGDGPIRAQVEAWIDEFGLRDRVHLLGHRDDVESVLASLDVLVLPSYAHEGVPQIILQAQAVGRAVVGTRIGGIPEVIRDGETGLLVPPRDPEALAGAIGRLISDGSQRARMGNAAATIAASEYGLDVMCARLEAIYDRYLGSTSR